MKPKFQIPIFKISLPKGHLFSTYAKFSEKLKFLDH